MKMIIRIFLLLFTLSAFADADIFMKKNPDGSISYSDQPQENADKVVLQPVNVLKGKGSASSNQEDSQNSGNLGQESKKNGKKSDEMSQQKEERIPYKTVSITSPNDQETLQNPVTINISASSDPGLQTAFKDKFALYVNGSQVGEPSESGTFSIPRERLPRGTYTFQVAILDGNGQALITSSMITVFVKYKTIAV